MIILKTTIDGHTVLIEEGDTHINLPELQSVPGDGLRGASEASIPGDI